MLLLSMLIFDIDVDVDVTISIDVDGVDDDCKESGKIKKL